MENTAPWVNDTGDVPDLVANDYEIPLLGAFLFYFVQCLYGTVFVVGLLGNTLVIYVVLRYTKMQTVTNLYILNLAVADECFLIGIPFIMTTMGLGYWPFGNVMCKIYMTTTSVNQFTSSLLLTVMSADRYIAVCHPIDSSTFRTPFIAKVVSMTTWGISFLMIVPIFLYAHTQQVHSDWAVGSLNDSRVIDTLYWSNGSATTIASWMKNHTRVTSSLAVENGAEDALEVHMTSPIVSCNIYWPENEYMNGQAAFTLYTFTLAFAIPLILILVFYILVIRKLKTVGPTNKSKEKRRSHRKVTRLVLTVVTVYVLCWLPYWVSQVSLIFTPPKASQSPYIVAIFLLAGCLGYSNSAVNPILYAFLSDNFKKSFMKACTCAERRDVNKALTGENSVFTRRGRNSERGFGHNDSRSRIPPMSGNVGRSIAPQETVELSNPVLATIQQEVCASSTIVVNRTDEDVCDSSGGDDVQIVIKGSIKLDGSFTKSQNSTKSDGTIASSRTVDSVVSCQHNVRVNGSSHVLHSDL
ncbi:somatostatin receptor type 5 isoform X2 [Daphnia magna]|uniref:G-protein coupled receptors family 1 profile domain-containing protein n=2 Tax=Daphnia magna TaxID=35525 RepID=A0ABQ9YX25_9CRUS|nr:somatostatin receptor type 5 isoform X2 [Daphnia magna]KAK4005198.1 hypothetical protein OUZ56_006920 [Daphnia magna]